MDNVHVSLGPYSCLNVRVDEQGQLHCTPRQLDSYTIINGGKQITSPTVTVHVGYMAVEVGSLVYEAAAEFHPIMIVTLAILGLITLVSLVTGCMAICCPRKTSRIKSAHTTTVVMPGRSGSVTFVQLQQSAQDAVQTVGGEANGEKSERAPPSGHSYDLVEMKEGEESSGRFKKLLDDSGERVKESKFAQ